MSQKAEAAPALPKVHHAGKENVDPFFDKQKGFQSAPGVFGAPAAKQLGKASNSSSKGRTPLQDITSLFMLQGSLPPKQQQQAGSSAGQKGLWGQVPHAQDKLSAGQAQPGGASVSGHRLAAMR